MEKQSNFKDLPKDFQDKMLKWEEQSPANLQLKALEDIVKKTQTVINELNNIRLKDDKNSGNMGSLLMDIRESLDAALSKEDPEYPEMPDYSKPVVEAVVKLEKALSSSIKSIDVKPKIDVASPVVKVDVPKIDIKGIEKILKTDIPKAFEKAIKLMPKEMPEDYTPLIAKFDEMAEILQSIDTASRLKPTAPKTVSVTNPDGSLIGAGGGDGAILDGVDSTIKATVKDIGTQITTNDFGLVSNSVIHGVTTGGGGGYVDVKVNPSGALTVDSTISGTAQVVGNVASAATDSGNPVKIGAKHNTTQPTFTDGQRGDLQIGTRGSLRVQLAAVNSTTGIGSRADNADATAVSATADNLSVINRNSVYNGTSWDRMRGDTTDGIWVNVKTQTPAKATDAYAINNKEATATYKYFGFQKSDGGWYIMRKTIATNIFEYVAGASAYSTAWTNRATQTYTDYATAF